MAQSPITGKMSTTALASANVYGCSFSGEREPLSVCTTRHCSISRLGERAVDRLAVALAVHAVDERLAHGPLRAREGDVVELAQRQQPRARGGGGRRSQRRRRRASWGEEIDGAIRIDVRRVIVFRTWRRPQLVSVATDEFAM